MKRNILAVVKANTSPISEKDFESFLLKRHGAISRENASADTSTLDHVSKASLASKGREASKHEVTQAIKTTGKLTRTTKPKRAKSANKTVIVNTASILKKKGP